MEENTQNINLLIKKRIVEHMDNKEKYISIEIEISCFC